MIILRQKTTQQQILRTSLAQQLILKLGRYITTEMNPKRRQSQLEFVGSLSV